MIWHETEMVSLWLCSGFYCWIRLNSMISWMHVILIDVRLLFFCSSRHVCAPSPSNCWYDYTTNLGCFQFSHRLVNTLPPQLPRRRIAMSNVNDEHVPNDEAKAEGSQKGYLFNYLVKILSITLLPSVIYFLASRLFSSLAYKPSVWSLLQEK